MAAATDLARMVPGFDFLQGLLKNASAGLPNMGQWVAPTLNPEELEKRIQELKTVQFWLEQNARLLATTIQAMEVQRMTLSTLQTMNLPLADIGNALRLKPLAATPPAPDADGDGDGHGDTGDTNNTGDTSPPATAARRAAKGPAKPRSATGSAAPPAVDPLQWWSALTQQFTELATQAVKDSASGAAKNLAGAVVNQSVASASGALKKASGVLMKKASGRATPTPRKR